MKTKHWESFSPPGNSETVSGDFTLSEFKFANSTATKPEEPENPEDPVDPEDPEEPTPEKVYTTILKDLREGYLGSVTFDRI